MTSISTSYSSSLTAWTPPPRISTESTDDLRTQRQSGRDLPPPPKESPRGELNGMADRDKLNGVSRLLDMESEEVTSQVSSAKDVVALFQEKGVDLGQLRSVMNNGDLFDVMA